jgi:hypothetical protein
MANYLGKNPSLLPGHITPGKPKRFSNVKMTQYNDLVQAAMTKPHIIDAVQKHFSYKKGMLSELFTHMGKTYNPNAMKDSGIGEMQKNILKENFMMIDNYRFAFKVATPNEKQYRFTRNATPSDPYLGKGGKLFNVWINSPTINKDDVLLLEDLNSQLLVVNVNNRGPKDTKLTVRLLILNASHSIPAGMVSKGSECMRYNNIKPERSTHGSRFDLSAGDMSEEYMTTQRFETDFTGHAAAMLRKQCTWFHYVSPDGKEEGVYWIDQFRYLMIQKSWEFIENQLWNGVAARNADGSFYRDPVTGNQYISGNGIYTQCNGKLRKGYNKLTMQLIEDIALEIRKDSIGVVDGKPTLLWMGGLQATSEFSKLLANEFNLDPLVFYYDTPYGTQGKKSHFTEYDTPIAKIIMSPTTILDQKHVPSAYLPDGTRAQSHRAFLLNISELEGGMDNITLVSMPKRDMIEGRVAGMSNPGQDGVLSTTEDSEGYHLLRTAGVAVRNPNCMAELYRPVTY